MRGGFETAIPHDETRTNNKAWRALFNEMFRLRRDAIREEYDQTEGKCES